MRIKAVDGLQGTALIVREQTVDLSPLHARQPFTALSAKTDAPAQKDDFAAIFCQSQQTIMIQGLDDAKHKKPPYTMLSL